MVLIYRFDSFQLLNEERYRREIFLEEELITTEKYKE
jgi:hypothetical protein